MTRGVVYVAYGEPAKREARYSAQSLAEHHPRWPVAVISDERCLWAQWIEWPNLGTPGRWAKVNLDRLTPFNHTLFLDADTRVYDKLDIGFDALEAGWEFVMVGSMRQGDTIFSLLLESERRRTVYELPLDPYQLNTGVIWFRKTRRVTRLFAEWRRQWKRWKHRDQAALVRALALRPVSMFLLGRPYNGGAIVAHRFGACRRGR